MNATASSRPSRRASARTSASWPSRGSSVSPPTTSRRTGRPAEPKRAPAERVEHLEHGERPSRAQREPDHAREPVVRVDQVVLGGARDAPPFHALDELVEVIVEALAGHRRLRARRQVNDTHPVGELDDARDGRVLRAREDVHLGAHATELTGDLADVHVHPARLLAAQGGERAGVNAHHRDPQAHAILTVKTSAGEGPNSYLYRSSPRRKSKRCMPRWMASRTRWTRSTSPGAS